MGHESTDHETSTRRDYMKYGGAVVSGGLLAGCTGSSGSGDGDASGTTSEHRETTASSSNNSTDSGGGNTYSVTMSPMGTVDFTTVPQTVMAATNYVDMAAALGHGTAVKSTSRPSASTPSLEFFYATIDTPTDWIEFEDAGNYSKETLYELDSDVHFLDPAYLSTLDGWSNADIEEIEENVGPFFGNMYSRKHRQPPEAYRDSYQYYTLWELTETYAEVFKEHERFTQLSELKETLLSKIQSKLPPSSDRPTVGMVYPRLSEDAFYVHKLNQPGYFFAHTRPLAAVDAFTDITTDEFGGQLVDYEGMLKADPDIIIMNHGISSYYDVAATKQSIRNHSVGSELAAVQNGRLYASGNPRQGPIMNLFQLEMTAKQLYPDQFGEWPGYVDGEPYPDIPKDKQLFDRQHIADIINGDM